MKVGKSGPFTEHRLLPNGEWETVKVHESLEAATEALREETAAIKEPEKKWFTVQMKMKGHDPSLNLDMEMLSNGIIAQQDVRLETLPDGSAFVRAGYLAQWIQQFIEIVITEAE